MLAPPAPRVVEQPASYPELADIKGQETAKRALEIAAAGGHNLLLIGPPGSGKSMLAARLPGLLPPLDPAEMLEVCMIASVAGLLHDGRLTERRPFRNPHHATSRRGDGRRRLARPAGRDLARPPGRAVPRRAAGVRAATCSKSLRQPLETGRVTVARANAHVTYPARFQLVAAMNPCRCGYLDDPALACGRAPRCARDYQARISGPLFDRIDLHVEVPALVAGRDEPAGARRSRAPRSPPASRGRASSRPSASPQRRAPGCAPTPRSTASCSTRSRRPTPAGRELLLRATERMQLTARGYHRVLRVARTIADLDGTLHITRGHIAEALSFRRVQPDRR